MCITLLSTAHPGYPFILLNNRDEFLTRPTARADWWETPHAHVLGGRDLQREERGTWLAVTRDGRLANLTNFREEGVEVEKGKSRGGLVNAFVTPAFDARVDDERFVNKRLVQDIGIQDVGGFTLLLGHLRAPTKDGKLPGLAIVSNRTSSAQGLTRIATQLGETHGLSNSHYGDLTWPKVVHGEQLLKQAVHASVSRADGRDKLIASLFDVLSVESLPRPQRGEDWNVYARQLRNSIFIPPVGGETVERKPADKLASADGTGRAEDGQVTVGRGVYGTQRQTVVLVDGGGHVTFVERTVGREDGGSDGSVQEDRTFEFEVEGWEG